MTDYSKMKRSALLSTISSLSAELGAGQRELAVVYGERDHARRGIAELAARSGNSFQAVVDLKAKVAGLQDALAIKMKVADQRLEERNEAHCRAVKFEQAAKDAEAKAKHLEGLLKYAYEQKDRLTYELQRLMMQDPRGFLYDPAMLGIEASRARRSSTRPALKVFDLDNPKRYLGTFIAPFEHRPNHNRFVCQTIPQLPARPSRDFTLDRQTIEAHRVEFHIVTITKEDWSAEVILRTAAPLDKLRSLPGFTVA